MQLELKTLESSIALPTTSKPDCTNLPPTQIACISAASFHMHVRRKKHAIFSTSLYELDRALEAQGDSDADDAATLDEIRAKLPMQYHLYEDAFSKAASDRLPLHCLYNY